MKKIMFILFILLLPNVVAGEINLEYPEEVQFNEEFEVDLELIDFESGMYDVKIDITREDNRISRILYNENWKSTFYYLNGAMDANSKETFLMKIDKGLEGKADIVVKIRKNGQSSTETFEGYEIEITQSGEVVSDPLPTNLEEDEIEADLVELEPGDKAIEINPEVLDLPNDSNDAKGVIELNSHSEEIQTLDSKSIKRENGTQESTKARYSIYGLLVFCVALMGLFYLKKQKKYENEFR